MLVWHVISGCVHRHPQLNGDFRSVTSSQTTTEAEDNSFVEAEGVEAEPGGDPKSLDPALLQALSFAANLTLQDEEDTLGKVSTCAPPTFCCV